MLQLLALQPVAGDRSRRGRGTFGSCKEALEPLPRQACDFLQGAGLLEQVRGTGDDLQFDRRRHLGHRLAIECDDLRIGAAHDQQRRGTDAGQRLTGQVGPASARDHGVDGLRPLGRRHGAAPPPVLAPK